MGFARVRCCLHLGGGCVFEPVTHPRAYGNFARLLAKYVREEKVITLREAIRRLTGLPAANLGLDQRGLIREGYFADLVVVRPRDHSRPRNL